MNRTLRQFAKIAPVAIACVLQGCGGLSQQQTMLRPGGPMSASIESLWWYTFAITLAVFVIVVAFLATAAARRRSITLQAPELHPDPDLEQRRLRIVIVATAITTVILFSVLGYSVVTGKRIYTTQSKSPLSIQVIGHQWWWEVRYPNSDASQTVVTANEIHVPTNVPIVVETSSRDVIHSFWAPNIQGKRDLIPGYTNAFWFQADQAGVYRGQCAEFCGHQHAHMAFYIVAESPQQFQAWLSQQIKSAPDPDNDERRHGQQVFLSSTCIMCHTIRGTQAGSHVGPDLTHIGSRLSIGAATLPNNPGSLGGWIADPQSIKPGVRMPPNPLPSQDLQAVVAYLTSLK